MLSKEHIENILKANGVPASAPDENIRSVLLSARYKEDEIDTALMVLRENVITKETRVDGLHKVFRSNEALNSSEIFKLLGVEVDIDKIAKTKVQSKNKHMLHIIVVVIFSFIFALLSLLLYMYIHEIGFYHHVYK